MAAMESNVLGIYIKTHGQLSQSTKLLDTPNRITIKKFNLGGYGCLSYPVPRTENPEEIAISLTYGEHLVCSQFNYQFIHKNSVDTYEIRVDTEDSCEVFEGNTRWLKKKYTFDETRNNLFFAFHDKTVNIVDCTIESFEAFLSPYPYNSRITKKITSFIANRDRNNCITTEDIFMLIDVIKIVHGITNVTILDESCNILKSKTKSVVRHRGKEELSCLPIHKSEVYKLPFGVGYGGKQVKTRKFKRKKFTKT